MPSGSEFFPSLCYVEKFLPDYIVKLIKEVLIMGIPFGFEYVEKGVSTKNNPIKHWVVRVSTTPLDALESQGI